MRSSRLWKLTTASTPRKGIPGRKHRARVNFFGGCPSGTSVTLETGLLHYSNLTLLASFHHTPRSIRTALDLIERGVIRVGDFVDGEASLDELPELFRSMAQGNRSVKTRIRMNA